MGDATEMIQMLKKMREGEKVICKHCHKGIMKPIGDHKVSHCFVCDNCHSKWNIN